MIAAVMMGCAVLNTQGWELRDISEAGISLKAPAPFRLVGAGSDAEAPQSVERTTWRSEGADLTLTVQYERWKAPHFSPEASLGVYVRRALGIPQGGIIQPARMGGLNGAVLLVTKPTGLSNIVFRAKSNDEAWQIELKPTRGALSSKLVEEIRESVVLAVQPEEPNSYDAWGNLTAKVEPLPMPNPVPATPVELKEAKIKLILPVVVTENADLRTPEQKEALEALSEWQGGERGLETIVSYFRLKKGQALDFAGWVANYGSQLRSEGFTRFEPTIEEMRISSASGRAIRGIGSLGGRPFSIQIILLSRGQECWAIQTRIFGPGAGAIEKQVSSSIRLQP